jgi:succinyl-CoA synthetase beta subunit
LSCGDRTRAGSTTNPRAWEYSGGITRCDEVANGLIAAFAQLGDAVSVPFVVRLDGTNDVEGRRILAEAGLPNVHTARTMNEAAERVVALAKEGSAA